MAQDHLLFAAKAALQRLREAGIDPLKYTLEENVDNIIGLAMESWGNDPRSVCLGVFDPATAEAELSEVLDFLSYEALLRIVDDIRGHGTLDTPMSQALLRITPYPSPGGTYDGFNVDFKSSRIGHAVMETMHKKEKDRIGELYRLFNDTPQTSSIAGWCFETIAHDTLAARKTPLEALRKMHKDDTNANAPCFKTNAALSPAEPPSIPTPQKAAS